MPEPEPTELIAKTLKLPADLWAEIEAELGYYKVDFTNFARRAFRNEINREKLRRVAEEAAVYGAAGLTAEQRATLEQRVDVAARPLPSTSAPAAAKAGALPAQKQAKGA